jgi:hypothetical protein
MYVFRHDDVSINAESKSPPYPLKRGLENLSAIFGQEQWATMIAAECDEMTLAGVVKTLQSPRHGSG